jgi:uncharacterized membrane protein YkvA (DUF1232 family)
MYCTNCGARVGDGNFCARCGAPVKREAAGTGWDEGERDRRRDEESRSRRDDDRARDDRRQTQGSGGARRRAEEYLRDPARAQELLSRALNKASSRRGDQTLVDEFWEYLQLASRMVMASIRGEYTGLSGKSLTLIVAALLYYISPIDLIPDFLPIAGLLDEITVLGFALRSLRGEIEAFREWERDRGHGFGR